MADTWDLIADLYKIALMDGEGTAWQESKMQRGESMTRTIRPFEAMTAALQLMKLDNAGRRPDKALTDRARQLIRLAKWHKTGMKGELTFDEWDE